MDSHILDSIWGGSMHNGEVQGHAKRLRLSDKKKSVFLISYQMDPLVALNVLFLPKKNNFF